MSITDVARRLGVRVETAKRLVLSEGFPAVRIDGGRWHIDKEAYEKWLSDNAGKVIITRKQRQVKIKSAPELREKYGYDYPTGAK